VAEIASGADKSQLEEVLGSSGVIEQEFLMRLFCAACAREGEVLAGRQDEAGRGSERVSLGVSVMPSSFY
jgi:hypothetical protein